jgi:hypothetical protein
MIKELIFTLSELYEICVSRAADKIKQMDEAPVIYGPTESKLSQIIYEAP